MRAPQAAPEIVRRHSNRFLINTILLHVVEATNSQLRVIPEVPIQKITFTTKEAPGKHSFSGVVDYMLIRTSDETFARKHIQVLMNLPV